MVKDNTQIQIGVQFSNTLKLKTTPLNIVDTWDTNLLYEFQSYF